MLWVMPRLALILSLAGGAAAQDVSFRVDTNLVTVTAMVRAADGRLAGDLRREDFEIFENGEPQTIRFFGRSSDLPLTLALAVDASGGQKEFIRRHRRDLAAFLKSVLTPRDQAMLAGFGDSIRLVSDLTNRVEPLMDALRAYEKRPSEFPAIGERERRVEGTALFDAQYALLTGRFAQIGVGNRRALIVFSDGEDNSSARHMLDVIDAAQAADTILYAIRYTDADPDRLSARNKYGMRVMARLARETGGADFDGQEDNLRDAFRTIGEELRTMYELAYQPSVPPGEGGFRRVEVRVKRGGFRVRSKSGYSISR
jgi:Ca-activated chloride channel family protein